VFVEMCVFTRSWPRPPCSGYLIAHLSDTHLAAPGVSNNQVLDAVVLSGDLTDTGHPDAYRRLHEAVGTLGRPAIFATSNHDVRAEFHRSLLGRQDIAPVLQTHRVGGLRIITRDSTGPGAGHGRLSAERPRAIRRSGRAARPPRGARPCGPFRAPPVATTRAKTTQRRSTSS